MEINIEPVSIFPDTATKLRVTNVQIRQLGDGGNAVVSWELLTQEDQISSDPEGLSPPLPPRDRQLKTGVVFLSAEEYDGWGSDDAYVLNLVVQKLGLTPA